MQEILTLAQSPEAWIALITLIVMEVSSASTISFSSRSSPTSCRRRTASAPGASGIGLALVMRLALLGTIAWIVSTDAAGLRGLRATAFPGRT